MIGEMLGFRPAQDAPHAMHDVGNKRPTMIQH
jgi:hypothetical protein